MNKLFDRDLDREFKRKQLRDIAKDEVIIPMPTYDGYEWEQMADRAAFGAKIGYNYDDHESRLQDECWQRAPTPAQAMKLIGAYLDGSLDSIPEMKDVVKDMLECEPEFLCHAVCRIDDFLHIYENVTGLVWDGKKYEPSVSAWYSNKVSFDVSDLEEDSWNPLTTVASRVPSMTRYFYGDTYWKLNEEFQDKASIYIPGHNDLGLIGLGCSNSQYDINCGVFTAASRGVRKK